MKKIEVEGNTLTVLAIDDKDDISLTDMSRAKDGKDFDAIIAVGYRVNSKKASGCKRPQLPVGEKNRIEKKYYKMFQMCKVTCS